MASKMSMKDLLCKRTEKPVLERLYLQFDVPSDQLSKNREVLLMMTSAFNRIASRNFDAERLLGYILNRRKAGDWPTLGVRRRRLKPVYADLSEEHVDALRQVYIAFGKTSDNILLSVDLQRELAEQYFQMTGDERSGSFLLDVILAKRKKGDWERICEMESGAFSDISEVA